MYKLATPSSLQLPLCSCHSPSPVLPVHPHTSSFLICQAAYSTCFLCLCLIVKKLSLPGGVHHIMLSCLPVGLLFLLIHHWITFLLRPRLPGFDVCLFLTLYILPAWPQSFNFGFRAEHLQSHYPQLVKVSQNADVQAINAIKKQAGTY